MNLTPKAKVSLRMLKIQHLGLVIQILEVVIRIPILESVSGGEKVKFGLVIRISIPKSVFGGEKFKFGLVIRIPILESFLNSEKVKFCLVIQITKRVIRIPSVKAADES